MRADHVWLACYAWHTFTWYAPGEPALSADNVKRPGYKAWRTCHTCQQWCTSFSLSLFLSFSLSLSYLICCASLPGVPTMISGRSFKRGLTALTSLAPISTILIKNKLHVRQVPPGYFMHTFFVFIYQRSAYIILIHFWTKNLRIFKKKYNKMKTM